MEKEFVQIAKKYVSELKPEQEDLVRGIARCKKYGGREQGEIMGGKQKCSCGLCLRVAIYNINELMKKKSKDPLAIARRIYNNPYKND